MKRSILVGLMAVALLAALGGMLAVAAGVDAEVAPLVDPSPNPGISLNPLERQLTPSSYTTVTVDIENVEGLYAFQFNVYFDPQVVIVDDSQSAQDGIQILPGDWFVPVRVGSNSADNAAGRINYSAIIWPADAPAVSGSGTVATITFQGLGFGSADIYLADVKMFPKSNREEDQFAVDVLHGCRISVTPPLTNRTYLPLSLRNAP